MSERSDRTLVIALVAVAVVLAGVVAVIAYQQSQKLPEPTAAVTPPATPGAATQPGATQPGATAPQPAPDVDPTKATKVPKGTEPEEFVKGYYEACEKGDWKAAFDALPVDKKAGNSPEALEQQVSGYGVKAFNVTNAVVEGDNASVTVDQVTTSYGTFENTWTFVKKDGRWLVATKAVTGMK